jgi:acyl CoA:acetate/3-ketoacid CoA transferase beta subunit
MLIKREILKFSKVKYTPYFFLSFCSNTPSLLTEGLIILECTFPLTGQKCVSRIITELAVFDVDFKEGLTLIEIAEGVNVEEIREKTEAPFKVAEELKTMLC